MSGGARPGTLPPSVCSVARCLYGRGDGACLLRALPQYALNLHRDKYTEFVVPHMMLRDTMVGTGHLPKFADDAYATADDRWLIPTGEVPLTAMHRGEILDADSLPLRYTTHTVCFRREAGAAGKDTRGMQRLHEFHKVELMIYSRADQVAAEFAGLLHDAETSLRGLRAALSRRRPRHGRPDLLLGAHSRPRGSQPRGWAVA